MITIRQLGITPYEQTWQAMKAFTDKREKNTPDELWVCQHQDVFTQGLAGQAEHLLQNPTNIPIVHSDRGGQITFHNIGQAVIYCLIDIKRLKMGIKQLVCAIEDSVIKVLASYDIDAKRKANAPGVYVNNAKISALGLKVRRGLTYHGLSININNDLTPFSYINPCGYENLKVVNMTQLSDKQLNFETICDQLCHQLTREFYAPRH